jgi:hypothetical protein
MPIGRSGFRQEDHSPRRSGLAHETCPSSLTRTAARSSRRGIRTTRGLQARGRGAGAGHRGQARGSALSDAAWR